jgi:uncharacterized membrane protein
VKSDSGFGRLFASWLCGVALIYCALFGIGKLLFGQFVSATLFFAVAAVAVFVIQRNLQKINLIK